MTYRRDIDGLRSFAVLPVILFHAELGVFPGGYVGVDVFFVISGFLITGLLADDMDRGTYSLLRFYERRARRLIPALFTVFAVTTVLAFAVMTPAQLDHYAESLIASALFVANVFFWLDGGYFAPDVDTLPLIHIWSLAVEEQFYLIFPPLLFALWHAARASLLRVLWALWGLSFVLCVAGIADYPDATFYLLPARAWELLSGSLCALYLRRGPSSGNGLYALLGLGMILVASVAYQETTPFPSHFALLPVGGTVLVLRHTAPGQIAHRILTFAPFVWIGLISYSAYLWHQPLLALARVHSFEPIGLWVKLTAVILSLGLAALTWRFVEKPFRGATPRLLPRRNSVFAATLACLMVATGTGLWGMTSEGRRVLWVLTRKPDIATAYRLLDEREYRASDPHPGACRFSLTKNEDETPRFDEARARVLACFEEHGPGVAILGDSHASDLLGSVLNSSRAPFIVGLARGSCRFEKDQTPCVYDDLIAFLSTHPDVFSAVIFQQAGYPLIRDHETGHEGRRMFTDLGLDETVPDYGARQSRIADPAAYLAALPDPVRAIWLGPRLPHFIPDALILKRGCAHDYTLRPNLEGPYRAVEKAIRDQIEGTKVEFLSQLDLIDLTLPGDLLTCDTIYWTDGDHLSATGEIHFGQRMQLLQRLGLEP